MSSISFNVSIAPSEALNLIREYENADLVHDEFHEVDTERSIGTQVYEKYYFRTKNRAALVVIIDNFRGVTNVRAVATGSSEGLIFNFDWGAADNFVSGIEEILQAYIVE